MISNITGLWDYSSILGKVDLSTERQLIPIAN